MGYLRILLAISIIFIHTGGPFGYQIISAKVAIQAFFIISGFYMALIIHEKYDLKKNAYKTFITNRFLRIYPTYWLILALTVLLLIFQCAGYLPRCLSFPLGAWNIWGIFDGFQYILKNIFIFTSVGYFTPSAYSLGTFLIPYAWTLGVELLFYSIAPFLVKRRLGVLITIAALSFLIRIFVFRYNTDEATTFLYLNMWFLPADLVFFMLGAIAYRIYRIIKNRTIPTSANRAVMIGMIVLTLLFTILLQVMQGRENVVAWIYYLCIFLSIPFLFNYTKQDKLSTFLGEISYTVYISHFLIISLFPRVFLGIDANLYPFFIMTITFIFAFLVWKYIDRPINIYRQNRLVKSESKKKANNKKLVL